MNKTGTIDQPFMFSTKQYDTETGLQYFGYRFYNPSVGRWITRDPLGELGGAAKAPAFFAGGLNLYQYVANDPINAIDPSGRQAFFWHFGITYGAARNSGLGVWDSMKHGWAVTREDRNATDRSASAANVHAMAGETASGQYQSREEALAAADLNMATGSLPSAIHTGQDYPGHNGESMENWGWNWSTAGHILNDLFPSLDTISQAYQNTQKIFSNRLRPCK
jgi:RHS repeat-associated protein